MKKTTTLRELGSGGLTHHNDITFYFRYLQKTY